MRPDWGERTLSFRPGDRRELMENMICHFMTGLRQDDWGLEIMESMVIGKACAELLSNYPRRLLVKDEPRRRAPAQQPRRSANSRKSAATMSKASGAGAGLSVTSSYSVGRCT